MEEMNEQSTRSQMGAQRPDGQMSRCSSQIQILMYGGNRKYGHITATAVSCQKHKGEQSRDRWGSYLVMQPERHRLSETNG